MNNCTTIINITLSNDWSRNKEISFAFDLFCLVVSREIAPPYYVNIVFDRFNEPDP